MRELHTVAADSAKMALRAAALESRMGMESRPNCIVELGRMIGSTWRLMLSLPWEKHGRTDAAEYFEARGIVEHRPRRISAVTGTISPAPGVPGRGIRRR